MSVTNRYERDPGTVGFPNPGRRRRGVSPRTRTFEGGAEFDRMRTAAELHPCEPYPLGCGLPAGDTCRIVDPYTRRTTDEPLTGQPAHMRRMQNAGVWPRISKVGDGQLRPGVDRDPSVPPPAANRARGSGAIRGDLPSTTGAAAVPDGEWEAAWSGHQRGAGQPTLDGGTST